jgi:alpha-beta hydrolase superfamily lysophospholipase
MKTQEGTLTGIGGVQRYYRGWLPDGEPKATVVICHGINEHGGRYAHIAEFLAGRGYAVWAADHRGHGRSEGIPGYVRRFDMYVEDMRTFVAHVEPPGKVFIYGHSMGALITLGFATRFQDMIDGFIITGVALSPGGAIPGWAVAAAKLMSALAPKLSIQALPGGTLSHDPAVEAQVEQDPLIHHGKISARLGAEILRASDEARANLGKITVPVLIMHGTADSLVDPSGSQEVYDAIGSADKTLKWWEGMYHEVHNEPAVQGEVLATAADWLDARL